MLTTFYSLCKDADKIFKKLIKALKKFGIKRFFTDAWGAYQRNIPKAKHVVAKNNTQRIGRKNLNL